MDFIKDYNVAGGNADIILKIVEKKGEKVSLQVITDAGFDGTTDTVELVQSNDRDLPLSKWHALPEAPLVLATDDSHLLSTFAHTAKFLALRYIQGDGTAGVLTLIENYKN